MSGRCRRAALGALLLLVCAAASAAAAGEYRTVEVEGLKITIDSEWGARTAPGYLPVRFDITNLSEARVIEIAGQATRYFRGRHVGGPGGGAIRQEVRLARGDRVRFTVPVPIIADNENIRFEIREAGRTLERFNYHGFQSRLRPDDASVLIVADSATAFGKVASGWARTSATPAGGPFVGSGTVVMGPAGRPGPAPSPRHQVDFVLGPARLPDSWLGFTSLRAVVIGPQEWEQLSDAQKSALLEWAACGGDLLFVDGDLRALLPDAQPATAAFSDGQVRAYLFGRIHLLKSEAIAASGLSDVLTKAAVMQDANWSLPANRASDWGIIASRGFRLPIPGIDGIPARAYLAILIVFSLLIGPVNYWLVWRMRQPVLMVLTAPLISAMFILLLAGYVVAGEGFGVRGRAVTFTMLDQARKHAATRASVSLYAAGMAPSGGLRFARDEAVFTLGPDGIGSREIQTLDLTDDQRFVAGAILARSPTNLELMRVRPARERLSFARESGGMAVVNGLGSTIRTLAYRDGNTIYKLSDPLFEGQKGILKPGAPRGADVVPYGMALSTRFQHLFENFPDGSYVAVLERSPFWNPGVDRVDERDSFHVVLGWVRGQP